MGNSHGAYSLLPATARSKVQSFAVAAAERPHEMIDSNMSLREHMQVV